MSVRKREWTDRQGRVHAVWIVDAVLRRSDGQCKRVRERSPVNTRRGATQHEAELREAYANGVATKRPPAPTLREFAPEYMKTHAVPNNKPSTVQDKEGHLTRVLLPTLGGKRLDQIGSREIDELRASMLGEGLAANTVNNHLRTLGNILNVAVRYDLIEAAPTIKKLPPGTKERFLDEQEVTSVLAAIQSEPLWHTMILTALRTGLRRGEVVGLQWDDVDLKQQVVKVRRSVSRAHIVSPKGGNRDVPLSPRTVRALAKHRHDLSKWVFCDPTNGGLLKEHRLRPPLRRACKRAGIKEVGWHVLRHTFASHLVMKGVSLKVVQELLGHKDLKTTMRYAHLAPQVRRDAVTALDD